MGTLTHYPCIECGSTRSKAYWAPSDNNYRCSDRPACRRRKNVRDHQAGGHAQFMGDACHLCYAT